MSILDQLHRFMAPIQRRISMILVKALLQGVDDSKALQVVKCSILKGEVKDGIDRLQPYGLSSHPSGGEVLLGCIGGNRDNVVAIMIDDASSRKKNLPEGDVCVYRKGGKTYIHLKDAGKIEIYADSEVHVNSPSVKLSDATSLKKLVTSDLITAFNTHVHTGVTTGAGSSLTPATPLTTAILTSKTEAG